MFTVDSDRIPRILSAVPQHNHMFSMTKAETSFLTFDEPCLLNLQKGKELPIQNLVYDWVYCCLTPNNKARSLVISLGEITFPAMCGISLQPN